MLDFVMTSTTILTVYFRYTPACIVKYILIYIHMPTHSYTLIYSHIHTHTLILIHTNMLTI